LKFPPLVLRKFFSLHLNGPCIRIWKQSSTFSGEGQIHHRPMNTRTHPLFYRAPNPRRIQAAQLIPTPYLYRPNKRAGAPICYKTSTYLPSFDTRPSQIPALSGSFSPSSAMAGGNMFARALSYVVNEFLVEGLANKYTTSPLSLPLPVDLSSLRSRAISRLICRFVDSTCHASSSGPWKDWFVRSVPNGLVPLKPYRPVVS
jgi:hypothetical protein